MLAITHILAIVLMIRLLSLDRNEVFVALLFGVFIDLDHLLGIPPFVQQHGVVSLTDVSALMASDVSWKSLIHDPVAFIIVAPVSVMFRYLLPLLAWGLHIVMDYVQEAYLGLSSIPEMVVIGALTSSLLYLEFKHFLCQERACSFFRWEMTRAVSTLHSYVPIKRWVHRLLQSRLDLLSE